MRTLLLVLVLARSASAAVTAASQYQVWSTGDDLNGGCFDASVAVAGTNRNRQTDPHVIFDGATITATATSSATLTITGYTVVTTDNGNCLKIASGTNFTAGTYTIVSVDTGANTWTLNADPTTGVATAMVGRMGGARATLTGPTVVAGNIVWVKATGTYSIGANVATNTAGTSLAWITFEGYTNNEGDGGKFTLQRSAGSSFVMWSSSGAFRAFRNFIVNCASGTTVTGLGLTGGTALVENVKIMNCTSNGVSVTTLGKITLRHVWVTGQTGSQSFNVQGSSILILDCVASGGSVPGFVINAASSTTSNVILRSIAANNSGASSDGFRISNTATAKLINVVSYGNGRDGIRWDTSITASAIDGGGVTNSIVEGNAGYGMNATAANVPFFDTSYNAFYNNTAGARNNYPVGPGDITLTASAFTNAAGGEFTLNNTAGGGTSVRAAGGISVFQYGGTNYADIGVLQHQDSGSGGGTRSYTWVQ